MKSPLRNLLLTLVAALAVVGVTSCGSGRDSTIANPVAADPVEDALSSQGTIRSTQACPTGVTKKGWYRSTKRNALCYYAEMAYSCSSPIYAYNRRQSNNQLATWSGATFAYACHDNPVVGGGFRGQWAIGSAAGPKDPSATGWYAYKGTEAYTPKVDPNSAY
jgi:hypothetical protein